jgi:hypothetical protein
LNLLSVIDENIEYFDTHRDSIVPDFGVWVEGKQGSQEGIFLAHGPENIMRETFGNIIEEFAVRVDSEGLLPVTTVRLVR